MRPQILRHRSPRRAQSEVAPGDSYTVVVGRKHRVTAITDIRFVEVSTPELDDVRRYDDDYGRGVE